MNAVIIDDFLSPRYFSRLKEIIENNFWWKYKKCITFPNNPNECLYSYGFDHDVILNSNVIDDYLFNLLTGFYSQLLDVTDCSTIAKSRFDMVTYSPDKHKHTIHVDEYFSHTASVFYFTDSDAETVIYDQQCFSYDQYDRIDLDSLKVLKTIKPKENRLVFFDGSYLHTGHSPSEYKNRIIINSDLVK